MFTLSFCIFEKEKSDSRSVEFDCCLFAKAEENSHT